MLTVVNRSSNVWHHTQRQQGGQTHAIFCCNMSLTSRYQRQAVCINRRCPKTHRSGSTRLGCRVSSTASSCDMEAFIDIPEGSDFPLNNLPYGAYTRAGSSKPCLCVALGDQVVDLGQLQQAGYFTGPILGQDNVFSQVSAAASLCGVAAAVYLATASVHATTSGRCGVPSLSSLRDPAQRTMMASQLLVQQLT
jgi:hypothetical protein